MNLGDESGRRFRSLAEFPQIPRELSAHAEQNRQRQQNLQSGPTPTSRSIVRAAI